MFDKNLKDRFLFPLLPAWNDVGDDERGFAPKRHHGQIQLVGNRNVLCLWWAQAALSAPCDPSQAMGSDHLPAKLHSPVELLMGVKAKQKSQESNTLPIISQHPPAPARPHCNSVCCTTCRHHLSSTWYIWRWNQHTEAPSSHFPPSATGEANEILHKRTDFSGITWKFQI